MGPANKRDNKIAQQSGERIVEGKEANLFLLITSANSSRNAVLPLGNPCSVR